MPATQERGDTTRQAILAAALTLFLRQGYHATTVRQIAGAAGIVPGAVYNHFGSKEDLYRALLHEADIYGALGEAVGAAQGDTMESLLRDAAHRLLAALRARGRVVPLMFVDVLEFEARNVASLAAADALPSITRFVGRVYTLGRHERRLRPIRPDVLVRVFLGLFASYFITTRFFGRILSQYPGMDVDEDVIDDFLDIFMHGVLRPTLPGAAEGGE